MNRLSSISLASDWKTLLKPLESNGRLCISELHGSAKAFFLYSLQRTLQRPLLIISANPENAEILWRDLAFFSGPGAHAEGTFQATDPAIQYPAWDVLPAEFLSPSPEISIERLRALEQLRAETARFVVAPLEAAPSPDEEVAPPPPEPTPPPAEPPTVHIVVSGENLTRIASSYDVTLLALLAVNDIGNPNLIYPNQRVDLPPRGNEREGQ